MFFQDIFNLYSCLNFAVVLHEKCARFYRSRVYNFIMFIIKSFKEDKINFAKGKSAPKRTNSS